MSVQEAPKTASNMSSMQQTKIKKPLILKKNKVKPPSFIMPQATIFKKSTNSGTGAQKNSLTVRGSIKSTKLTTSVDLSKYRKW